MSTSVGIASSATYLPNEQSRPSWLYCCGAHATAESAMKEAELVTSPLQKPGVVFWHHTLVTDFIRNDHEEYLRQAELVSQIATLVQKSEGSPLTAIGHSYGAELIRHALLRLNPEERSSITAITLGGASMIPNSLARSVRNYVHVKDLIAEGANHVFDSAGVLSRVKKVFERVQSGTKSIRQAVLQAFARETHDNTSPMLSARIENDEAAKKEKTDRFQQLFIMANGEIDLTWVARGLEKWVKPLQSYNIFLVHDEDPDPKTPFGHSEELIVDDEMCKEAVAEMIRLGQESLVSHVVSSFDKISIF